MKRGDDYTIYDCDHCWHDAYEYSGHYFAPRCCVCYGVRQFNNELLKNAERPPNYD